MSKRAISIRIGRLPLILLIMFTIFAYGFLCNQRRLPGYSLMRKVQNWTGERTTLRRLYFLLMDLVGSEGEKAVTPKRSLRDWHQIKKPSEEQELTDEQREAIAKLQTIGNLSGYEKAPDVEKVTIFVPELTYNGLNMYTSGHGEEVVLMDMHGRILNKWTYKFRDAFPTRVVSKAKVQSYRGNLKHWRRVYLYPNGDLLAI